MSEEEEINEQAKTFSIADYNTFDENNPTDRLLDHGKDATRLSMQEAIDKLGFGKFQIHLSIMTGLCYMSDAMEIMLLSILSPELQCTWQLTGAQEALLTTAVFAGMAVSSNVWGLLFDKYGRRFGLLFFAVISAYFGSLSALSPSYEWILVLRFIVGLGLGATPQSMTYYSEFLPTKSRGQCLLAIALLWALGSVLEAVLAIIIIPTLGWRWLVAISSLPLWGFAALYKYLPESPRYYIAHGQLDKAKDLLNKIAAYNNRLPIQNELFDPCTEKVDSNRLQDLFHPRYLCSTILLSFFWFSGMVIYYGTSLLTTALFENTDGCHGYETRGVTSEDTCESFCRPLATSDYVDLMLTTLGDIPGILLSMVLMAKLRRKTTLAILLLGYTIAMLLCNICMPRNALVVLLFVARGMSNGASQGAFVYTTEVYPTSVRAIGIGWNTSMTRVGVIITPFIAQMMIRTSAYIPITTYAVLGFIGCIAVVLLPIETAKRKMTDTLEEQSD